MLVDRVMAANLKSKKHFLSCSGRIFTVKVGRKIFLTNIKKGIKKAEFHADFKSGEKGAKKCAPKKL